jgi:modification methylase
MTDARRDEERPVESWQAPPGWRPEGDLPVTSVWLTCQHPARVQRRGRYVPQTRIHPAKMLPAIAAHAVAVYTQPGDLVLDPMCGVGTTLVEAVRAGRDAIGVDLESRFTAVAAANLRLAAEHGATGQGRVITGDATGLARLLPAETAERAALVLTSPPYGSVTHPTTIRTTRGEGLIKEHEHYRDRRQGQGRDRRRSGNLAYAGWDRLMDGFTQILTDCYAMLRPGGHVVITSRPIRRSRDDLIDLPSHVLTAATAAGFEPVERCVALLAAVHPDKVVHRASMFALMAARRARAAGIPVSLITHEDVHILRKPGESTGSRELKDPQPEPHPEPRSGSKSEPKGSW